MSDMYTNDDLDEQWLNAIARDDLRDERNHRRTTMSTSQEAQHSKQLQRMAEGRCAVHGLPLQGYLHLADGTPIAFCGRRDCKRLYGFVGDTGPGMPVRLMPATAEAQLNNASALFHHLPPDEALGTDRRERQQRRVVLLDIACCLDEGLPIRVSDIARHWGIAGHRVDHILGWLRNHGLIQLEAGQDADTYNVTLTQRAGPAHQ